LLSITDNLGMKPNFMNNNESSSTNETQSKLITDLQNRLAEKTRELNTVEENLQSERDKRTAVEALLAKSEENYHNVVENAHDVILILQNEMIRYCNSAITDMTGYSKEELTNSHFDFLINPDDRDIVMERHRRRLRGETVEIEYTIRFITKNRETVWGRVKAAKTLSWEGHPATLAFISNITEQKETEIALRESEEQYRVFIEKMPNGFSHSRIILNENQQSEDFVFLDVNESFLRSTKLKKEQIVGIPVNQAIPELREIMPDVAKLCERVALQGESYQGELYFKTFDKWFEINVYSVKPGYFNIVYSDVTQKKRAEEASEKSKAYLEYSLNSAPDGVLLLNSDYCFTFINPAVADLFGISDSEIIGKSFLELAPRLLPEKKADWIHQGIRQQLQSGIPVSGLEIELHRPAGSKIPVSFSAAAIRDRKNQIIGVVAFLKDITERKRIQELMIQTEKMMSVGGLAAGMAHEINNPLGGMLQGAQNIMRRLSPDLKANQRDAKESGVSLERLSEYIERRKIDDMLAGILSSGQRAARIITNMLQFSRQSESNLCPNNINQLIDEVLELSANDYDLAKKFDFRKIKIIKEYGENLPEVVSTKTEIEQVILNLLKNAVYAMMKTAEIRLPRLVIRTGIEKQMVRIEVEDNGPGLNPDVQKRIFEPFFTTKPMGEGTGLGLSVSYMIITNNHKGVMEVNSEPGNGARFTVRLPIQNNPKLV
jgi:PAS domain S-box-containing protein